MEQQTENSIERAFVDAFAQGRGSAFSLGVQLAPERAVELIFECLDQEEHSATLHEGSGHWVLALAGEIMAEPLLRKRLIETIDDTQNAASLRRYLQVLQPMAARGSESARETLYRCFVQQRFPDANLGGKEIIDLDRYDGFLFCVEVLGQRLEKELEFETFGDLFTYACERLNAKQVVKRLKRRAERSPTTQIYREKLINLSLIADDDADPLVSRERRGEGREIRELADRAEGAPSAPADSVLAAFGLNLDDPSSIAEQLEDVDSLVEAAKLAGAMITWTRTASFPELADAVVWSFRHCDSGPQRAEAVERLAAWKQLNGELVDEALRDVHDDVRRRGREHSARLSTLEHSRTYERREQESGRFFEFDIFEFDRGEAALASNTQLMECILADARGHGGDLDDGPFASSCPEALDFSRQPLRHLRLSVGEKLEDVAQPRLSVAEIVEVLEELEPLTSKSEVVRLMPPVPIEAQADFESYEEFISIDRPQGRACLYRIGTRYL